MPGGSVSSRGVTTTALLARLASPQIQMRVDRSGTGRINGISLATVGEADGWGFALDEKSIDQIVATLKAGEPGRWMHTKDMGSFLGRWENVRREGKHAVADFVFSELAQKVQPTGLRVSARDYLLELAEKEPDQAGASLNVQYTLDPEAKLNGLPVARIVGTEGADFVGDPAANPSGLFAKLSRAQLGRLGDRLRSLREEKELSLEEVAERASGLLEGGAIEAGTIGQIERGDIETPSDPVLGALAQVLGTSKEALENLIASGEEPGEGRFDDGNMPPAAEGDDDDPDGERHATLLGAWQDLTPEERACVSDKISVLVGEGAEQDQAIARAISECAPTKARSEGAAMATKGKCTCSGEVASLQRKVTNLEAQLAAERKREGTSYVASLATASAAAQAPIEKADLDKVQALWDKGHHDAARVTGDALLSAAKTKGQAAEGRTVSLGAPPVDADRAKNRAKHEAAMLRARGYDVRVGADGLIESVSKKNRS